MTTLGAIVDATMAPLATMALAMAVCDTTLPWHLAPLVLSALVVYAIWAQGLGGSRVRGVALRFGAAVGDTFSFGVFASSICTVSGFAAL